MAQTPPDISISSTLLRQVPLVTGEPSLLDQILTISQTGSTLERRSWSQFQQGFVSYDPNSPANPSSTGSAGMLAVGADAIYTHDGASWGKTLRFTSNWDEITGDSRFLLVSSTQTLSPDEQKAGQNNLGIGVATSTKAGMMYPTGVLSVNQEGALAIPLADKGKAGTVLSGNSPGVTVKEGVVSLLPASSAVIGGVIVEGASGAYVPEVLSAEDTRELVAGSFQYTLPVAGVGGRLGGIRPSPTLLVNPTTGVATIAPATTAAFGGVKLAFDSTQPGLVTTVGVVSVMIQDAQWEGATMAPATYTTLGGVIPTGAITLIIDADGKSTGKILVQDAAVNNAGIVKITPSNPKSLEDATYDSHVPTALAMKNFVMSALPTPDARIASPTVLGKIKASSSLQVDQNTGVATVPLASPSTSGLVRVSVAPGDSSPVIVPSHGAVSNEINGKISEALGDLGTGSQSRAGLLYLTDSTGVATSKTYVDKLFSGGEGGLFFRNATMSAQAFPSIALPNAGTYQISVGVQISSGISLPSFWINAPFNNVILHGGIYYTGTDYTTRVGNIMALRAGSDLTTRCFLAQAASNASVTVSGFSFSITVYTSSPIATLFTITGANTTTGRVIVNQISSQ